MVQLGHHAFLTVPSLPGKLQRSRTPSEGTLMLYIPALKLPSYLARLPHRFSLLPLVRAAVTCLEKNFLQGRVGHNCSEMCLQSSPFFHFCSHRMSHTSRALGPLQVRQSGPPGERSSGVLWQGAAWLFLELWIESCTLQKRGV